MRSEHLKNSQFKSVQQYSAYFLTENITDEDSKTKNDNCKNKNISPCNNHKQLLKTTNKITQHYSNNVNIVEHTKKNASQDKNIMKSYNLGARLYHTCLLSILSYTNSN